MVVITVMRASAGISALASLLGRLFGSEKIESHESSFRIDVGADLEAQFLSSHPAFKPAGRLGWQRRRFAMVFLRANRLNF